MPWAVTGLGGALLGGFAGTALANKGRQEEVNTSGLIGALGGTAAGLLARPHLDAALAPAGHSAGFTPVEMDAVWGR